MGEATTGTTPERTTPMTVLSPLVPGWAAWLRLSWLAAPHLPLVTKPLRELSFIHFAHWSIVDRWPPDRAAPRQKVRSKWLLFQTNYNGSWEQYIAAFSRIVPWRIRAVWGGSRGFPGPVPTAPFLANVAEHELATGHYYRAYPEASVTMVSAALALEQNFRRFAERAQDLDAGEFRAAWERFLTDNQHRL